MPSFIILGYVWQILGRKGLFAPHPWAALKSPILNRVKTFTYNWCHMMFDVIHYFKRESTNSYYTAPTI